MPASPTIGFALSSEEHPPSDLVRFAAMARDHGFRDVSISDHFHPWNGEQGQSPFVWSVLGGISAVAPELRVGTAVTCPTIRMHPAIVAHAAASASLMAAGLPEAKMPNTYTITVVKIGDRTMMFDSGNGFQGRPNTGLLDDGLNFANTVADRATAATHTEANPLVVLSTDMETFGHHHRHGEMALAHAVEAWRGRSDVELITAEQYLQRHPATEPGRLVERTSWSCAHGVERWRSDCGCRFEEVDGQDQRWRRPLRDVLDAVADIAGRLFNDHAGADLVDPWAARYDYGMVLGARPERRAGMRDQFLGKHLAPGGSAERAWVWMEAERLRLEAWSSCAWFFDSPDRIETVQVLVEARASLERYGRLTDTELLTWFDEQVRTSGLVAPATAGSA